MTNEIIKPESKIDLFGVDARAFNVVVDTSTGRILNQKISTYWKTFEEDGRKYRIEAELRFDDECKNGHESFSITGTVDAWERGKWVDDMGGCIHDEITKHFPSLAHLIKWHLVSTDGPMHYIANTCYSAGDRDFNGRAKGEPSSWSYGVRFGNSPVTRKTEKRFFDFLKAKREFLDSLLKYGRGAQGNPQGEPLIIEEVPHKDNGKPGAYAYGPKYTVKGFPCEWHQCPFDNKTEALEFTKAFNSLPVEFVTIPTAFSDGKARELDHARSSAAWPEATDEQLSVPRDELEKVLLARLPALLIAFKADMLACGFLWPEIEAKEEAIK